MYLEWYIAALDDDRQETLRSAHTTRHARVQPLLKTKGAVLNLPKQNLIAIVLSLTWHTRPRGDSVLMGVTISWRLWFMALGTSSVSSQKNTRDIPV
jgi:hypothetical protein